MNLQITKNGADEIVVIDSTVMGLAKEWTGDRRTY